MYILYVYCIFSDNVVAERDALADAGHIRLYEPKKPGKPTDLFPGSSFDVIPTGHIMGKAPLMIDFGSKTIPFKHASKCKTGFQFGMADTAEGSGDGSVLMYINHFALVWSRSKKSLFTYVFPTTI
jgi:hypothetical protein